MGLLDPRLPEYPLDEWVALPYGERLRLQCGTWTTQGFGTPWAIYAMYAAKAVLFVVGWALLVQTESGDLGLSNIAQWWATPTAFIKAVLWAMLFEGLGFGCGSGPLTGRYMPPFVAFTHFLRPGTTRLAPWPGRNPLAGGHRRTILDVALYAAIVVLLCRSLYGPLDNTGELWAVVGLVPVLGLRDKTAFLILRSEHYWLTLVVIAISTRTGPPEAFFQWVAGAQLIQFAIWWGAATSKLNRHFPSVVAVMVSNAPLVPQALKRRMFVDAPTDMRPSRLASMMAHGGTVIEYAFPLALLLSDGGVVTNAAILVMFAFHLFIMSSVALGVPTEWNVFFLYSMFVLFGEYAEVGPTDLTDPRMIGVLVVALVAVPVLGNLRPDLVSFLPAMRYYAGNWDTSQWWFRKGTIERLDDVLTKTSQTTRRQLSRFYDEDTTEFLLGKVSCFRGMHLHGRLFSALSGRAVEAPDDHDLVDGELVAGLVLGWNFGDGHLHDEHLLSVVQEAAGFAPGDLRVVMVEAQPMGSPTWRWRIHDAATGELARGRAAVADFADRQPWDTEVDDATIGVGR